MTLTDLRGRKRDEAVVLARQVCIVFNAAGNRMLVI